MPNICAQCGNALPEGVQFCTNCGAKVAQSAVQAPAQPPPKKSGGCGKILLITFIILLLVIAGFGALGYWGYRKIAQKVEQKWEQTKSEITKSEKNESNSHADEITEEPCPASDLSTLSLDRGTIP